MPCVKDTAKICRKQATFRSTNFSKKLQIFQKNEQRMLYLQWFMMRKYEKTGLFCQSQDRLYLK